MISVARVTLLVRRWTVSVSPVIFSGGSQMEDQSNGKSGRERKEGTDTGRLVVVFCREDQALSAEMHKHTSHTTVRANKRLDERLVGQGRWCHSQCQTKSARTIQMWALCGDWRRSKLCSSSNLSLSCVHSSPPSMSSEADVLIEVSAAVVASLCICTSPSSAVSVLVVVWTVVDNGNSSNHISD